MIGVVGTVIDVKSLMNKEQTEVRYSRVGSENIPLIKLKKDRGYYVPYYQREIRWDKRNVLTLINDLSTGEKFLGNIILTEDENGDYEILDGQQRMTSILLLYLCIKKKYGERLSLFDLCDFHIKSFEGFSILLECSFEKQKYEDRLLEIDDKDDYKQAGKYIALWDEIYNCERLSTVSNAEVILQNLSTSELNVIINKDNREKSIARFLDVNLKGVKLDTEDIFKSYLYAQDVGEEIHKIWSEIKKKDVLFREKKKGTYPLMVFIEHYFTCVLPTDERFKIINFNSDFELVDDVEVESKQYIQGTHILTIFKDRNFVMKCMKEISCLYDYFIDIVGSEGPGSVLKAKLSEFNAGQSKKNKLDDNEIKTIHNLTKKILMDKEKVPKCLLLKYFLDTILNPNAIKENYINVYALSTFSLVFSLFQYKKELQTVSDIVSKPEWITKTCEYISNKLSDENITNRQILAAYRFGPGEESEEKGSQQYRCKTLAMIYNFLDVNNERISVKNGKHSKLLEFITNDQKFSVEHFIINESGSCIVHYGQELKKSFVYHYPKKIKKMKDSLFNYIFISVDNNNNLGNAHFAEKINLIKTKYKNEFDAEECAYSKLVISAVENFIKFPNLEETETEEDAKNILDVYFTEKFEEGYTLFSKHIVKNTL